MGVLAVALHRLCDEVRLHVLVGRGLELAHQGVELGGHDVALDVVGGERVEQREPVAVLAAPHDVDEVRARLAVAVLALQPRRERRLRDGQLHTDLGPLGLDRLRRQVGRDVGAGRHVDLERDAVGVAGVGEQRLGLLRVVRVRLHVLDLGLVRLERHLTGQGLDRVVEEALDDRLLVGRVVQRLPDAHVGQRRAGLLLVDREHQRLRPDPEDRVVGVGVRELVEAQRLDVQRDVGLLGLQGRDALRLGRQHRVLDLLELRLRTRRSAG